MKTNATHQAYGSLLCPTCAKPLQFDAAGQRSCCNLPGGSIMGEDFVVYDLALRKAPPPEMVSRDAQAGNYLKHPKLPPQVDRTRRFVRTLDKAGPILELGCGPGPMTQVLLEAGFDVIAVDFSANSLALNRRLCGETARRATFVQADLTTIRFVRESVSCLMMADFLQHIPTAEARETLLANAFAALKPGGKFLLSFFNVNIVNWYKGDIHGDWLNGTIRYTRLPLQEVERMIPSDIVVTEVVPMNILRNPRLDRLCAVLPFARRLSRMIMLTGFKASRPIL